jgi:hypothetical protein
MVWLRRGHNLLHVVLLFCGARKRKSSSWGCMGYTAYLAKKIRA